MNIKLKTLFFISINHLLIIDRNQVEIKYYDKKYYYKIPSSIFMTATVNFKEKNLLEEANE